MVKAGLLSKKSGYLEAMVCVKMLALAVGPALNVYMNEILG
jgi:hypothetical protein